MKYWAWMLGAVLLVGCDSDSHITRPIVSAPCDTVPHDDDDRATLYNAPAPEVSGFVDRDGVVHLRLPPITSPRTVYITTPDFSLVLEAGEFEQFWHPSGKYVEARFPYSLVGQPFDFVVTGAASPPPGELFIGSGSVSN